MLLRQEKMAYGASPPNKYTTKARINSELLLYRIGRSDRIRTCGIDVPNVARYQLRHTPMCEKYSIFRSISVSGQTCGQTTFIEDFAREQSAEKVSVYKGFQRFLILRGA